MEDFDTFPFLRGPARPGNPVLRLHRATKQSSLHEPCHDKRCGAESR